MSQRLNIPIRFNTKIQQLLIGDYDSYNERISSAILSLTAGQRSTPLRSLSHILSVKSSPKQTRRADSLEYRMLAACHRRRGLPRDAVLVFSNWKIPRGLLFSNYSTHMMRINIPIAIAK